MTPSPRNTGRTATLASTQPAATPWDQQPGEPPAAYASFRAFLDLGYRRTLKGAERLYLERTAGEGGQPSRDKKGPKASIAGYFRQMACRWNWVERARLHDNAEAMARERARLQAAADDERRKFAQLHKRDNLTLTIADRLTVKAVRMLEWPMEEVIEESRTVEDGGRTIIIKNVTAPAKWTLRDAAYLLRVARELQDSVFHPQGAGGAFQSRDEAGAAPDRPPGERAEGEGLQGDEAGDPAEEVAAAQATLQAWFRHQQRRMLEAPTAPPGRLIDPADDPNSPGPGAESPRMDQEASAEDGTVDPSSDGEDASEDQPGRFSGIRPPGPTRQGPPRAVPFGGGRAPSRGLVGQD